MLEPGSRIWVNIPGTGYVGVGKVLEPAIPVDEFLVEDGEQGQVPLCSLPINAARMCKAAENPEKAEHVVRVKWYETVAREGAIKEKGFFGNQNSVARPVVAKWEHTIDRLKKRFGVE